jgi:hypothetical protein
MRVAAGSGRGRGKRQARGAGGKMAEDAGRDAAVGRALWPSEVREVLWHSCVHGVHLWAWAPRAGDAYGCGMLW